MKTKFYIKIQKKRINYSNGLSRLGDKGWQGKHDAANNTLATLSEFTSNCQGGREALHGGT